jgi:hypothetical protein
LEPTGTGDPASRTEADLDLEGRTKQRIEEEVTEVGQRVVFVRDVKGAHRPVYITHELNRVTEPLLRTQQIDYLIVQDLNEIVRRATQFLREIPSDDHQSYELEGIPFRLLTQFNLG